LEKLYSPKDIEEKWQKLWLSPEYYDVFKFKNDGKPTFVIDTPPPFTSGELHMGHVYWCILNDTIARYKRMKGFDVLLPQGWDCQGLPTELKVQYKWKIPKENRELFRSKCIEWTNIMISKMKEGMIKIGYRPDWEQFEYRTMDKEYWKMVQYTLILMYEMGLIYKKEFPVHWCSRCGTALAQAETGYIQKKGKLYYIKFKLDQESIIIGTTRPELLNACVAIAINPNDERYKNILGKEAEVPIFGQKVRIIQDEAVDPKFGTGIVMICTYGDEQDIKWQQKYNLPIIKAVDEDGRIINAKEYTGLKIEEAREKIVEDLRKLGFLVKEEEILHNVLAHTERSDCMTPIEFLVKDQWFVKSKDFKEIMKEEAEKIQWIPKYMKQRLIDWIDNIEWDWVISRQRVFGTPIPFWYCKDCGFIIPPKKEDLPVDTSKDKPPISSCPNCNSKNISGTSDVCDCWIDSSITPLIITKFLKNNEVFYKTYPVDIRQQGHDIIRTWLYYTMLRCKILTGKGPFKSVVINGHILGPDGSRMSKSKGNVIMPEEGISKYGADALRQALLLLTLGSDFPFRWEPVKYGKSFLQKLWSSVRFASQFINNKIELDNKKLNDIDKWIISRLRNTISIVSEAMENYQFHIAVDTLQQFYWHDFCDQYIEAVKPRLYNSNNKEDLDTAIAVMYKIIWIFIRMFAPICPHITEEIYHRIFKNFEGFTSIHSTTFPTLEELPEVDGNEGEKVIKIIAKIRTKKVDKKIPLSAPVKYVIIRDKNELLKTYKKNEWLIKEVLHIEKIEFLEGEPSIELE